MKRMILILSLLISFVGLGMANDIVGTVIPVTKSSDAVSNITINGITQSVTWVDLPAASSANVLSVSLSTTVALSTTTTVSITNPSVPRNLVAMMSFGVNGTGVSSITLTGGLMTIVGKNQRGEDVTETMQLQSNSTFGGAIVEGMSFSTHCYSSITSLTATGIRFSGSTTKTIYWQVGTGDRIGIPGDFNANSDIITCNEAGTRTTTFVANPIYDSINFVTNPTGSNEYMVYFRNRNVPYR